MNRRRISLLFALPGFAACGSYGQVGPVADLRILLPVGAPVPDLDTAEPHHIEVQVADAPLFPICDATVDIQWWTTSTERPADSFLAGVAVDVVKNPTAATVRWEFDANPGLDTATLDLEARCDLSRASAAVTLHADADPEVDVRMTF